MDNEKSINRTFYPVSEKQIVFIATVLYHRGDFYFSLKCNVDHRIIHKINLDYHLSTLSDI